MLVRALPILLVLAAQPAAQVPFQHFVVATLGPGPGSSALFVDPLTGDLTPVTGLGAPLTELTIVTSETLSGGLFFAGPLIPGSTMYHVPMSGRDGGAASPITWLGLPGPIADALFGPGGNVFMVIGGVVPRAGLWTGTQVGLFALPLGAVTDGVAVAADGAFAYVLTQRPGVSTIWRHDGVTGTFAQVVGGLPEAKAFDLFPAGTPRLLVGSRSGDLYLADAATGQFTLFRAVGQGPIAALRHSPAGDLLFATDGGLLFTLASLPSPLATLPRIPTDIELGTLDAPSFFTFAQGCPGAGSHVPAIGANGAPAVGNQSFAVTVRSAPGGAPAVFVLGNDRRDWAGLPLPFDLLGAGAPGCAIAVRGLLFLAQGLSGAGPGAGTGSVALPIPNQPALVGARLMAQWWIVDLAANPLGLTVSDGGEAVLR